MNETDQVNTQAVEWLLEEDSLNPGVRYLALRDLEGREENDPLVISARQAALTGGQIPAILAQQDAQGFWVESGPGYLPKYRSIVWQVIFLAQLGADVRDERVYKACDYLLSHAIGKFEGFSMTATPSGAINCLQGNLGDAVADFRHGRG